MIVKSGCDLTSLDIKRFVRQQSANFNVPKKVGAFILPQQSGLRVRLTSKQVTFVDSIPKNRSGTYVRALLTEKFG